MFDRVLSFISTIPWSAVALWIYSHPIQIAVLALALWYGIPFSVWLSRYIRHRMVESHLVYMQIQLPREDSQKDKDKQVEKDFKEKIGIMEQFYRSIYEMRELSLRNQIRRWMYSHHFVTFEIVAQNKIVSMYVVVLDEYRDLIEKQITSYYPDADIQYVKPYEMHKPGYKPVAYYAYEANKFWFPIKTYKTIENDPLNSMTNVLSKLADDETGIIQFAIKPKDDSWRKKAEEEGTSLFKDKKKESFLSKIPLIGFIWTIFGGIVFGYDRIKDDMNGTNAPGAKSGDSYVRMLQTKEERAKHVGEKAQQEGFDTVIRLYTEGKTRLRSEQLMNDIFVAINLFKDPELNYFQILCTQVLI